MSIRTNILKVKKDVLKEVDEPVTPISDDVQRRSLRAINKGQGSEEWRLYMKLFVDDPNAADDPNTVSGKQLLRLIGKDTTENKPDFDDKRAYLVADGTCTGETFLHFGKDASDVLDQGM